MLCFLKMIVVSPEGHLRDMPQPQWNRPPCGTGLVILPALGGLGIPRWSEPKSPVSFQFHIYSSEFMSFFVVTVVKCIYPKRFCGEGVHTPII